MGYRKVGWLEQCWYVLKWKLTHLFKGGGEEVKQRKGYNWHGKSTWAANEHEREMSKLKAQPTVRQRKYVNFLCMTLKEHGIKIPSSRYGLMTRMDYADYIGELVALCEKNGIPSHSRKAV